MRKLIFTRLLFGFSILMLVLGMVSCGNSRKAKIITEPPREMFAVVSQPATPEPAPCIKLFTNPYAVVFTIADSLARKRIMYSNNPAKMADCSGIFHRFLQALNQYCDRLAMPDRRTARSTRTIARWYADLGQLTVVTNALVQSDLIQPGRVMFFGRRWTKYPRVTLTDVLAQTYHMAICVDVEKDRNGVVQSYRLFHGRRTGKVAAITDWHRRRPSRANLPPLGNWDEQWIGIAPLVILKNKERVPGIVTEKKGMTAKETN